MPPKPSRADVARLARVAESTVSRALNDSTLITETVKERVRRAARELSYVPSRQAALFAKNKTNTLAFVVPSYGSFPPFSRSYFPALLDGVVLESDPSGYAAMIILDKQGDTMEDYYGLVDSKTVDGLLFAVTRADFRPFSGLQKRGVPFVLINNYHQGLNSVDALPESGTRKALAHARAMGHEKIGYITGDMRYRNAIDRLEAFKRISGEYGLKICIAEGDFSKKSGYLGAEALLSVKAAPTLIMASSDRSAFGVMEYARARGLRVPEDLSVVGYDNLPPVQDVTPALSTIDHPITALARAATRLLIDLLCGNRVEPIQEWLETDYIPRDSTAARTSAGAAN